MFEPDSTYSYCIFSHAHCLSRSLSPTSLTLSIARRPTLAQSLSLYICNRLTLLPPTHKIYLHVCDWIISQALSYSPHPSQKLDRTISLQSIYISFQRMPDHTHFVSLSIRVSVDLAFSRRIFHTLKLPLHPSQSRSYLHCEGDSNLGLICIVIYFGGFRLYFRSIRPTTTPNTVANPT